MVLKTAVINTYRKFLNEHDKGNKLEERKQMEFPDYKILK